MRKTKFESKLQNFNGFAMKLFFLKIAIFLGPYMSCFALPVIFVHLGNSDYLEHSLWQAKQYNEDVILLGDEANAHYRNRVRHFSIKDYFKEADFFAAFYSHLSLNIPAHELFCIQRWFALKEFVKGQNIDQFFYCDSDVMVYCDIAEVLEEYNCEVALPHLEGYSGHNSFWTAKALSFFCDFSLLFYQDPENMQLWEDRYRATKESICDMTLLTEFIRVVGTPEMAEGKVSIPIAASTQKIASLMGYPQIKVAKLVQEDAVFDLCNIGHDEIGCYELVKNSKGVKTIKKIKWLNNQPYCYHLKLHLLLRFNTLHCQGKHKKLMQYLRRTKACAS